jgi:hypothetical protein
VVAELNATHGIGGGVRSLVLKEDANILAIRMITAKPTINSRLVIYVPAVFQLLIQKKSL